MNETIRETLRRLIADIMSDGKERKIPLIKSSIQDRANLTYGVDYTESQISGALNTLKKTGILRVVQRGVYVAVTPTVATADTMDETTEPESPTVSHDSELTKTAISLTEKQLSALYGEITERLRYDHEFILAELRNVDLSRSQEFDLQIITKIFNMRDTIKKLIECES